MDINGQKVLWAFHKSWNWKRVENPSWRLFSLGFVTVIIEKVYRPTLSVRFARWCNRTGAGILRHWYQFLNWLGFTWVSTYLIDRRYGGPEEGGWWYNWKMPYETRLVWPWAGDEAIAAIVTELHDRATDQEHGDVSSVFGGIEAAVYSGEDRPFEFRSTEVPHYE